MSWEVKYIPEALKDISKLDGSNIILVRKAIKKVSLNPLPDYDGGYGHPLSNKRNTNLSGFLKIKLRASGIRIVYKIEKIDNQMVIIIIGAKEDNEVYELASKRVKKHDL